MPAPDSKDLFLFQERVYRRLVHELEILSGRLRENSTRFKASIMFGRTLERGVRQLCLHKKDLMPAISHKLVCTHIKHLFLSSHLKMFMAHSFGFCKMLMSR